MQSLRTKFAVGLFVIIGMATVVLVVLWMGMSEYFTETRKHTAYFDESVQGLSRDSSVKYRGVNVGRVEQINVAPDGRLIEIIFTVSKTLQDTHDLVAQLKSVGITGIMYMELEKQTPGEKVSQPRLDFTPKHPVVATRPSEMKQFLSDLYEILSRIKQVDVEAISTQLSNLILNTNKILEDAQIEKISEGLRQAIENSNKLLEAENWNKLQLSARHTIENLNGLITKTKNTVKNIDAAIASSADNFDNAVSGVKTAAATAEDLFADGSQSLKAAGSKARDYDYRFMQITDELRQAVLQLTVLMEQLQTQPSRLLYGQPVPAKTMEQEKN